MKQLSDRSSQWIFYLVASFTLGAVFLRSILIYRDSPDLLSVLGLLSFWSVLFASEPFLSKVWSKYFLIYFLLQTGLIFTLLGMPGYADFFAGLFAILSMQVMLHLDLKLWVVWISLCTLVTAFLLVKTYAGQTIALVLIYTAGNVFYGLYARAMLRAQTTQLGNLALVEEVQQANQKLQAYSAQMEKLAVARERNRLARDLHDSVTQTVFSMTLTTQSALLLLERDPTRVEAQLDRLSHLTQNALSEMQLLISELRPEQASRAGLVADLKRYLAGGHLPENLSIDLEVQGEQPLELAEEQGLFHIIQEALHNTMKHAQTLKAQVRLHLTEPLWIEIEDHGQGFDLERAQNSGRVGLHSMCERAAEIGWDLQIRTSPGAGTCIRAEKLPKEARQA